MQQNRKVSRKNLLKNPQPQWRYKRVGQFAMDERERLFRAVVRNFIAMLCVRFVQWADALTLHTAYQSMMPFWVYPIGKVLGAFVYHGQAMAVVYKSILVIQRGRRAIVNTLGAAIACVMPPQWIEKRMLACNIRKKQR